MNLADRFIPSNETPHACKGCRAPLPRTPSSLVALKAVITYNVAVLQVLHQVLRPAPCLEEVLALGRPRDVVTGRLAAY